MRTLLPANLCLIPSQTEKVTRMSMQQGSLRRGKAGTTSALDRVELLRHLKDFFKSRTTAGRLCESLVADLCTRASRTQSSGWQLRKIVNICYLLISFDAWTWAWKQLWTNSHNPKTVLMQLSTCGLLYDVTTRFSWLVGWVLADQTTFIFST